MRTILPYINHPFLVKKIASAGLAIAEIPEGEVGIVDELTGKTVSTLPTNSKFTFVKTFNGKPMFLAEYMNKKDIHNIQTKTYQAEQVNKWKTTIDYCSCIESVNLVITVYGNKIYETTGNNEEVYSFTQNTPPELECFCAGCSGKNTYANHLMTLYLYRQILAMQSPYFTVEVEKESGAKLANEKAIVEFINQNKTVNTDDDPANDSERLSLVIVGLKQDSSKDLPYRRLANTPIKLVPTVSINNVYSPGFTEIQKSKSEVGSGIDLMEEEWNNYNFYSTNNYYWNYEQEFITDVMSYQFDANKHYDTVTFEYDTDKQYRAGTNEQKTMSVILASENGNGVLDTIIALFGKSNTVGNISMD